MHRPNIRTVNKLIARDFPGYSLVQERNYVRLLGPDTHSWHSTMFPTYRVSDSSPREWLHDVCLAISRRSTTFDVSVFSD